MCTLRAEIFYFVNRYLYIDIIRILLRNIARKIMSKSIPALKAANENFEQRKQTIEQDLNFYVLYSYIVLVKTLNQ